MSPREVMYQEGSSGNKEGITYSQCSTQDNTKISQQNNTDVKLRNTDSLKSRCGTKRKLLCRNEVESDNHFELKDCSVVLNEDDLDLIEDLLPEDENSFQKLKDERGAIVQRLGCETNLPCLHYEESVPVEIIYKGVSKQPRPQELKNIVKKKIITKEERNLIRIPHFHNDHNTEICRGQHVARVIESNQLNKNEGVKSVNLQSKKVLDPLSRSHSIPVDKFYNGLSKRAKMLVLSEEKYMEKKVERKVHTIEDKCMERKINIAKKFLDESKWLVCRESNPLKLDEEENMQIKSLVRTNFTGCNSDSLCCNACLTISENENVQNATKGDNSSNECIEIETNSQDRKESSDIRISSESEDVEKNSHSCHTKNALKIPNDDVSNGRIKCCECNMRFSTTLEVSKHLKSSGCYRKSKAKSKGVQKPTVKKVQDSREKIATKYSRHNSSSTCSEGSNIEEGDNGFSSPLEFSGVGSTTAFYAMNGSAPAFQPPDCADPIFHAVDSHSPSVYETDGSNPSFHDVISPGPSCHKTDGFSLSFHTTRDDPAVLAPTSVACDINPVFGATISPVLDTASSVCTPFHATNDSNLLSVIPAGSPTFYSPSSASPVFHATNDFLPISDAGGDRIEGCTASSEIPQDISELLFSCDMTTCIEDMPSNAPVPSFMDQFCDNRQDYIDTFAGTSYSVSQSASISRSVSSSPGSTMTSRYSTDVSRSNSPELSSASRCTTPEESRSSRSTSPLLSSSLSRCTTPDESKPSRSTSPQTLPGTLLGNISKILSQNGVPKLSSTTQLKSHSTQRKSSESAITSSSSAITSSSSTPEICRSDTFSHMFGLPVSRWHIGTLCCPTTRYSTIIKHINAHRKHQIRNYRCIGCKVKTSDYTKFINHIKQKNHHAKNAKHECGEDGCRLIFPSEASKQIHRKECHLKVSSYCKACGTQVVTRAGERAFKVLAVPSIGEHALKVHGELWM